jgi:DNA-binding GntR family transcriptional regulator
MGSLSIRPLGLYHLFRANGIRMRIAKQAIGARAASAAEARALGEGEGAPLLTMERSAYDEQGGRWSTATTSTGRHGTASTSP